MAVTREITPPWRHGLGLTLRRGQQATALGLWVRGKSPRNTPLEQDWRHIVERSETLGYQKEE